jgi:hypothetical protein
MNARQTGFVRRPSDQIRLAAGKMAKLVPVYLPPDADQCRTTSELLTRHFKGSASAQDWTVNVIILRGELEAEVEEKPVVKPEGGKGKGRGRPRKIKGEPEPEPEPKPEPKPEPEEEEEELALEELLEEESGSEEEDFNLRSPSEILAEVHQPTAASRKRSATTNLSSSVCTRQRHVLTDEDIRRMERHR